LRSASLEASPVVRIKVKGERIKAKSRKAGRLGS
jgi:hypothetical protein